MRRIALICSTLVVLIVFGVLSYMAPKQLRVNVDTESQVSFGSLTAKVNVVVFEEFTCVQCKRFHNEVMRQLFLRYVDTGKVRLTLIPVAYLDTSIPAFSAACCIGKEGPDHLKGFLDHVFTMKDGDLVNQSTRQLASSYAMKQMRFDFNKVAECIKSKGLEREREKVLVMASKLYKDDIHMPSVLVNGRLVSSVDKQSLFSTIEDELLKVKVNGTKDQKQ